MEVSQLYAKLCNLRMRDSLEKVTLIGERTYHEEEFKQIGGSTLDYKQGSSCKAVRKCFPIYRNSHLDIYIYIHIHTHVHIYIYIYIYTYRGL